MKGFGEAIIKNSNYFFRITVEIHKHNVRCENPKQSNHIRIETENAGSDDTILAVHEVQINSRGSLMLYSSKYNILSSQDA